MNERLKIKIALVIKKLREERGLSRAELAERCQLDAQFLALAEDEYRVSLTHLIALAEGLQLRMSEIIRQAEEHL